MLISAIFRSAAADFLKRFLTVRLANNLDCERARSAQSYRFGCSGATWSMEYDVAGNRPAARCWPKWKYEPSGTVDRKVRAHTRRLGWGSQFARIASERPIVSRQVLGKCGQTDTDRLALTTEIDECEREERSNGVIEIIGSAVKLIEKQSGRFSGEAEAA